MAECPSNLKCLWAALERCVAKGAKTPNPQGIVQATGSRSIGIAESLRVLARGNELWTKPHKSLDCSCQMQSQSHHRALGELVVPSVVSRARCRTHLSKHPAPMTERQQSTVPLRKHLQSRPRLSRLRHANTSLEDIPCPLNIPYPAIPSSPSTVSSFSLPPLPHHGVINNPLPRSQAAR